MHINNHITNKTYYEIPLRKPTLTMIRKHGIYLGVL